MKLDHTVGDGNGTKQWGLVVSVVSVVLMTAGAMFSVFLAAISGAFYLNAQTYHSLSKDIDKARSESYARANMVHMVTMSEINSLREQEGYPRIEIDPLPPPQ